MMIQLLCLSFHLKSAFHHYRLSGLSTLLYLVLPFRLVQSHYTSMFVKNLCNSFLGLDYSASSRDHVQLVTHCQCNVHQGHGYQC